MCDNWRKQYFDRYSCKGVALYNGDGDIHVKGTIKNLSPSSTILYWAACPPDYRQSYTGSGIPFPSPSLAYENTPNKGAVESTNNGKFEFKIRYPNSYYTGLGTVYMPPHVHIKVCDKNNSNQKIHTIKLSDGIPFRTLTYPPPPKDYPRCNSTFYSGRDRLPVRTQEQICRDSGYPKTNKMPNNFWGLAVPHP